jgi:hypothetical protein
MDKQGFFSALSELEQNYTLATGFPCSTSVFLKSLTDKDKQAFEKILFEKRVPVTVLMEFLKKQGVSDLGESSLYKHRGKKCRCFR